MSLLPSVRRASPSLVLIPGLAGDARMWAQQLAVLPQRLAPAVAVAHVQVGSQSIEGMAGEILAAHEGPLLLCGASMGGMLAMEMARQAPDRVVGMALLGTTARPESADMEKVRLAAVALFEQGRLREVIEPNVAIAFHPASAARADLVSSYLDFVLHAGAAQLALQNRAVVARPDARMHLPSLRCPVLVACGDSDLLTPPDCSAEIAALIPQAELHMVQMCGHMLTMEQPQAVNALLLNWLERHGW